MYVFFLNTPYVLAVTIRDYRRGVQNDSGHHLLANVDRDWQRRLEFRSKRPGRDEYQRAFKESH
jgi:hypothetical protein